MKKVFFVLALLTGSFFFIPAVLAQDASAVSGDIEDCIKRSDARALSGYFSKRVDLELPGNEGIYSKTQAEVILDSFFGKCKPAEFQVKHHGSSGEGASYTIGKYTCQGKSYRVYYLLKRTGERYLINQLRFEPES